MARIAVSGGFDPLHEGHLTLFRDAAAHGELVVILNSDAWLLQKKGFVFLPWAQRAAIIRDLKYVSAVVAVDDTDGTVCEALEREKPDMFGNGGDRKQDNTPEVTLCDKLGIALIWGVGGGKVESSSDIARRAWVERPWGRYVTLDEGDGYKVKKVVVEPGRSLSLQFHHRRSEYWYIAGPEAEVQVAQKTYRVKSGAPIVAVPCGTHHRLANPGTEPLTVIEVQTGEYLGEDDIIRLSESGSFPPA